MQSKASPASEVRRYRRMDMLGVHSKADEPRGDPLQPRHRVDEAHRQRRLIRLSRRSASLRPGRSRVMAAIRLQPASPDFPAVVRDCCGSVTDEQSRFGLAWISIAFFEGMP